MIGFILLLLNTSILLFLVIKNYRETRVRFKIDVTNNDKGQYKIWRKKINWRASGGPWASLKQAELGKVTHFA